MNLQLNDSREDEVNGLCCPYSKATHLLLYLYSMDYGTTSLNAEVNRVSIDMDLRSVKELGPFIRALDMISLRA